MTTDYADYADERAFQQAVSEGLVPKIIDSAVCISLAPSDDSLDAKFCVELGAMIMLDKPIIAIVSPGQTISEKFRLVADEVVEVDFASEAGRDVLNQVLAKYVPEDEDAEGEDTEDA